MKRKEKFLKKNPELIRQFAKFPDDWQKRIEKKPEPKKEAKAESEAEQTLFGGENTTEETTEKKIKSRKRNEL